MIKRTLHVVTLIIVFVLAVSWFEKGHSPDDDWFPFIPANTLEPGVIGMNEWLDAPAGKHGFLQMDDEHLRFENGVPVKLWGTNICSRLPFVEKARADSFADLLAKYGMNAVRFHKFSWYAYDGIHSTRFDKGQFERLDYFQYRLREKGI